ncbi:Oidioi.mRNA.OKI2018_I69.chr1.g1159.t1.cds [Oikopleura dioica]|uniref:Oidioi.mRNA.OKI2018_I69.chr1.g1159.t1.cds n=1 Tax=Oikopleura dioica TaxID=34765 RepID=A0ABN7SU54_OIKDI|nr:Oidioi.mRNA.OKI2018_I69.chr1.g1159.t1.cds [Oikopleura dioica]
MKIFNFLTLGAFASELATPHRNRREVSQSFTGEEDLDVYNEFLAGLAGGEVDDLEQLIMDLMAQGGSENERFIQEPTELEVRKFRQLKIIVLWLQAEQKFGRYCYYGCYCLPEGSHNIASGGYGRPVDNIDQSCFDFKQCYRCLVEEYDGERECKGEEVGYRFDLLTNDDGSKDVVCTNTPGSCRYNICQCDLQLARDWPNTNLSGMFLTTLPRAVSSEKTTAEKELQPETPSKNAVETRPLSH